MKTKKVNRYYCDFCGKGGGAAGHMRRHEERCTLNPQRVCGMCSFAEFAPKPLAELVALLPDPEHYEKHNDEFDYDYYDGLDEAVELIWDDFKGAADDCPACMLAAIRQAGVSDGFLNSHLFDYKKAVGEIFATHDDAEMIACQHG